MWLGLFQQWSSLIFYMDTMNSLQTKIYFCLGAKMKISQLNQTKYHAHDILEENT